MQTTKSRLSRRKLLATTALGLPALGSLGVLGLSGATPAAAAQRTGSDFLGTAETRTGCSYLWGGTGPDAFDCSGLIQWALRQLGVDFPRTSELQIGASSVIDLGLARKTPGAIMWHFGHVGISCGDGVHTFEARNYDYPLQRFDTEPGTSPWVSGGLVPGLIYPDLSETISLTVDGYWGSSTTRRLQEVLGTTADGLVSGQGESWKSRNPGLTSGWEWKPDDSAQGSEMIRAVQQKLGTEADGLIGTNTIKALQAHFGTVEDGSITKSSSCVKALQEALNNNTF